MSIGSSFQQQTFNEIQFLIQIICKLYLLIKCQYIQYKKKLYNETFIYVVFVRFSIWLQFHLMLIDNVPLGNNTIKLVCDRRSSEIVEIYL